MQYIINIYIHIADNIIFNYNTIEVSNNYMEEYIIERLKSQDAVGVSKCMYNAYGVNYPSHEVYKPEEIMRNNKSGELISVVAKTKNGEVIGHYAIVIENKDSKLGELGQAVVVSGHRKKGLMKKMRQLLEEIAVKKGIIGLYSAPVTIHDYSQRVNIACGSNETSIMLGYVPQSITFKDFPGKDVIPQRETVVVYFKYLTKQNPTTVYAPRRHREIISEIYKNLGVERNYQEGTLIPLEAKSVFDYKKDPFWSCSWIGFFNYGADFFPEFYNTAERLLREGIETIHLDLPLNSPITPLYSSALEKMGFFFTGIIPSFLTGYDAARYQFNNTSIFDFSIINVYSDFGKKLLKYIKKEYKRAEGIKEYIFSPKK